MHDRRDILLTATLSAMLLSFCYGRAWAIQVEKLANATDRYADEAIDHIAGLRTALLSEVRTVVASEIGGDGCARGKAATTVP